MDGSSGGSVHCVSRSEFVSRPDDAASRLRIAVAANFVYTGRVGGAEHMLYNLLRGLWGAGVSLDVLCSRAENLSDQFRAELEQQSKVRVVASGAAGPRFVAEQTDCLSRHRSADATIFPNYYVPLFVPRRLGAVVCVLHDMQYRHMRTNFSRRKRAWLRLAQNFAIRRCDRMIVISEFVRQDALRFLGARFADRIEVVPNPISWDRFGHKERSRRSRSEPTILTVAAQYEHKNLSTLLRAFALVCQRLPDARLVMCGQDYAGLVGVTARRGMLSELAASLGIDKQVAFTGYVDDRKLGELYASADVFAFPSLFEGFGMPPVEALGFGVPTLTTRLTAMPETTLGLGHCVEHPLDVHEWAERLVAMLRDPERHAPSITDVERLRTFYSPARIAAQYLSVIDRALQATPAAA